jgi:hypothetical protein
LLGSEFTQHVVMSSFSDPTFDQAYRQMWPITREAIIEWLGRGGTYTMPRLTSAKRTWRRWVKDKAIYALPGVAALSFLIARLV